MNKVISSTNTAKNMREFKKHKTMKSFFKQVEVKDISFKVHISSYIFFLNILLNCELKKS